jgi:hypothetical protein
LFRQFGGVNQLLDKVAFERHLLFHSSPVDDLVLIFEKALYDLHDSVRVQVQSLGNPCISLAHVAEVHKAAEPQLDHQQLL